jgi:hypothetical protein
MYGLDRRLPPGVRCRADCSALHLRKEFTLEDQCMGDYHLKLLEVWAWQTMVSLLAPMAWAFMA